MGDTAALTVTGRIQPTTQQFRADDVEYFIDMCLGTANFDDEGRFTGLDAGTGSEFPDLSKDEGIQYACWLTRSLEHRGDDKVRVTETGYLQGDWTATRALN